MSGRSGAACRRPCTAAALLPASTTNAARCCCCSMSSSNGFFHSEVWNELGDLKPICLVGDHKSCAAFRPAATMHVQRRSCWLRRPRLVDAAAAPCLRPHGSSTRSSTARNIKQREELCSSPTSGDHIGSLASADAGWRPAPPPFHAASCSGLLSAGTESREACCCWLSSSSWLFSIGRRARRAVAAATLLRG